MITRGKLIALFTGAALSVSGALIAQSGGFPSRPRFQSLGVGVVAPAGNGIALTGNDARVVVRDANAAGNAAVQLTNFGSNNGYLCFPSGSTGCVTGDAANQLALMSPGNINFSADNGNTLHAALSPASLTVFPKDAAFGGSALLGANTNRGSLTVNGATDAILTLGNGGVSGMYIYAAPAEAQISLGTGRPLNIYSGATIAQTISTSAVVNFPVGASVGGVAATASGINTKHAFGTFVAATGALNGSYSNGGIASGVRNSTGSYSVNLNVGYAAIPACSGAVNYPSGTDGYVAIDSASTTLLNVHVMNTAGTLVDRVFSITCMGT